MQELRQTRYTTLDLAANGDLEQWSAGAPVGWTLVVSAGNSVTQETNASLVYSGASAARLTHPNTGDAYVMRRPAQVLAPGAWYLAEAFASRLLGDSGYTPATAVRLRLINTTRNTSFNAGSNSWLSGVTGTIGSTVGTKYVRLRAWLQVPAFYAVTDVYEIRAGFTGNPGTGLNGVVDRISLVGPFGTPIHKLGRVSASRALATPVRQYQVELVDPLGRRWDVTDRMTLDRLGTMTEQGEEALLQLIHGDLAVTLQDTDGFVANLLAEATQDTRWQMVISRETGRKRTRWARLFAGVLDLPWSASQSPGDGTYSLRVFTYSKDLELRPASPVNRSFPDLRGSVNAGSASLTLTPGTSGLVRGDRLRLDDGTQREDVRVKYIESSVVAVLTANAGATFLDADTRVLTPGVRYAVPATLANDLLDAAGNTLRSVDLDSILSPYPVSIPLNANSAPYGVTPVSLVKASGLARATYEAGTPGYYARQTTPDAISGWTDGAVTNVMEGDWTPYLNSEPATILSYSGGGGFVDRDDGRYAWDHTNGRRYELRYDIFTFQLKIYQNGTSIFNLATDTSGFRDWCCEYDPVSNRVWYSYHANLAAVDVTGYYNVSGGTTVNLPITDAPVRLRCCRQVASGSMLLLSEVGRVLRVYKLQATPAQIAVVALPSTFGVSNLWTARYLAPWIVWLARDSTLAPTIVMLNTSSWRVDAVYPVGSPAMGYLLNGILFLGTPAYQTMLTLPDGTNTLVGWASGEWYVLANRYVGVIQYADLATVSVAKALADIATVTLGMLLVGHDGDVVLKNRLGLETQVPKLDLGDPLRGLIRTAIWEHYRDSVEVSGETDSGDAFSAVAGNPGRSAKRLALSVDLATSPGAGHAVAAALASYCTVTREQVDGLWPEQAELVRAMDVVTWDGRKWLVSSVQTDVPKAQQKLRLFAIVE